MLFSLLILLDLVRILLFFTFRFKVILFLGVGKANNVLVGGKHLNSVDGKANRSASALGSAGKKFLEGCRLCKVFYR